MNNSNFFPLERNRYFYGKMLTARDFETEQRYFNNKRRLLNRNVLTVVRGQDGTTARAWSAGWAFTGTTTFPSRWRPEWRLTTWVARYA